MKVSVEKYGKIYADMGIRIGIGNIKIGSSSFSWANYWGNIISATIETEAPTNIILTFPSVSSIDASDLSCTINGINSRISAVSWLSNILTVSIIDEVIYGDSVIITFKVTGQTKTVTNNVAWTDEYLAVYNAMINKPSGSVAAAQNIMVKILVNAGIWSTRDLFYLFSQYSNSDSEALINWINPGSFNATISGNVTFISLKGFKSAGGYIKTGWNPHDDGINYKQNDASSGIYSQDNTKGIYISYGIYDSDADCILQGYLWKANNDSSIGINEAGSGHAVFDIDDSYGLFIQTRDASDSTTLYQKYIKIGSGDTLSTGVPDGELYILGRNAATKYLSNRQYSVFFAGASLTDDEQYIMQNAIQGYMESINNGVNIYYGEKVNNYNLINSLSLNNQIVVEQGVNFIAQNGYFNIPCVTLTNNNVLIVSFNVRHDSGADFEKTDIGIKRSTDYGQTWSDDQIVFTNNEVCDISRKNNHSVLVDRSTNRIFMFCNNIDDCVETQYWGSDLGWLANVDFIYKYSDDDGETWSDEISLKSLFGAETNLLLSGTSQDCITMEDGTLIVPIYECRFSNNTTETGADFAMRAGLIYSTDHGDTWIKSNLIPYLTNECSIIEYEAGSLMMICRRWSTFNNVRVFTTDDLGTTWNIADNDKAIYGNRCERHIHKYTYNGVTRGLLTMPTSLTERAETMLLVSSDFLNWKKFRMLYEPYTPGSYSCICSNSDGKLFVVHTEDFDIHLFDLSNYADYIIAET